MKLRVRILLLPMASVAMLLSSSLGHVFTNDEGVHFKDPGIDFGAPPSRYALTYASYSMSRSDEVDPWRPGTTYLLYGYPADLSKEVDPTHLYHKASRMEASAEYREALGRWRWGWNHGVGDPSFERERIALLTTILRYPHAQGTARLLSATAIVNRSGNVPEPSSLGEPLRPFALYRSIDASKKGPMEKAKAFWGLAQSYPKSPVTEAALISIPRLLLGSRNDQLTDDQILFSRGALDLLARRFPTSRFRSDVIGWRGRIDFSKQRYVDALQTYRRQLNVSVSSRLKTNALRSILRCEKVIKRRPDEAITELEMYGVGDTRDAKAEGATALSNSLENFTGKEARQFWDLLHDDPRTLSFYLDYRLEVQHPYSEVIPLVEIHGRKALRSMYRGHILARLAEACYMFKRYGKSKRMALQSLQTSRGESDRALDTFLLGSLAKRNGDYGDARNRYESLLRSYPKNYLCGAARENLALLYEKRGQFGKALDTYRKLKYQFDIAYMLDIRMSPGQVAEYVASHRSDPEIGLLRFSLGVRYLRTNQFRQAATEFKRVGDKKRTALRALTYAWSDSTDKPELIQDPLQTAKDLMDLYHRYDHTRGCQARAEALTQVADYYYDKRDLLLYNPALWHQCREAAIAFSWNRKVASRKDSLALEKHHWEHECLARAYEICQQIRTLYPNSKPRFRVAYRQACAAEKLSNFNEYWRWEAGRRKLLERSIKLMKYAALSPDKDLAAKARKYKGVFADQLHDKHLAFAEELKYEKEHRIAYDSYSGWMPSWRR